jgi:hypothetical protein
MSRLALMNASLVILVEDSEMAAAVVADMASGLVILVRWDSAALVAVAKN